MTSTNERLYFGSVRIIESIPPGETRTGWNLFEELEPIGLMAKPLVTTAYRRVETADELRLELAAIRDEVLATGKTPILQLETHGSPDGIFLGPDEEFVPWAVLRPWLTEINEATRLNLLVILSACDGADMVQVVQPSERAAVLALIGPKRTMWPQELQKASIAFYRTLFEKLDAQAAWHAMNATLDPNKPKFAMFVAKFNFRYIMHEFLKVRETEAELAAAEKRIEERAATNGVPLDHIEQQRPVLRGHLRDFDGLFTATKTHYFFIDKFPENAARFPVTLEDCRRARAGD